MLVNKRILATISILAAVLLGLSGGVAVPSTLRIMSLGRKIKGEKIKIERRYWLRKQTRQTLNLLEDSAPTIADLGGVAIREGDELAFIRAFETAAAASNVTQILTLETVNQKELSPWEREIPIKIKANGAFSDIVGYLRSIEKLEYVMPVLSLSIVPAQQTSTAAPASGTVDAVINGVVYWQGKNAPAFTRPPAEN